jgi:hypothetical protein
VWHGPCESDSKRKSRASQRSCLSNHVVFSVLRVWVMSSRMCEWPKMEAVQKGSDPFGPFQRVQGMLNAELDHRSSSAYTLNVEPDRGPVHERSGSNRGSEPNLRITTTCCTQGLPISTKRSTFRHSTNMVSHISTRPALPRHSKF